MLGEETWTLFQADLKGAVAGHGAGPIGDRVFSQLAALLGQLCFPFVQKRPNISIKVLI